MGEVGTQADLAAWLLACIEEDEQAARSADGPEWLPGDGNVSEGGLYANEWAIAWFELGWTNPERRIKGANWQRHAHQNSVHAARWDPARVLVECDTKRRIIAECKYWYDKVERGENYPALADRFEVAMSVLRLLAAVYSDRPGYRAEWKPDGR